MKTIEDAIKIVENAGTCCLLYDLYSGVNGEALAQAFKTKGTVVGLPDINAVKTLSLTADEFKSVILMLLNEAAK